MSNPYLCDFQGIAITTLEVRLPYSYTAARHRWSSRRFHTT